MALKPGKTRDLVDILFAAIEDRLDPEIETLVGHKFPDDDVWLCFWMAKKFNPKAANAKMVFVNAGETLPGSEGDPSVLHFDTGEGDTDQHGKSLTRSCSAALGRDKLAKERNLDATALAALEPLIEMVTKVDNIEPMDATSLHYLILGYPRHPAFKNPDRTINWGKVQAQVFQDFDIIYGQENQRLQSRRNLSQYVQWATLSNGVKIASLLWHPGLRDAAYEQGAMVVVWTDTRWVNKETGETLTPAEIKKRKIKAEKDGVRFPQEQWIKKFQTGIQRNRNVPQLRLNKIASELRKAEAEKRKLPLQAENIDFIGRESGSPWFLHDSLGLILNGSRSWDPALEEYSILLPLEIVTIVQRALSQIPRHAM